MTAPDFDKGPFDNRPGREQPRTEQVGWRWWALFLALATFTQIAFKWGGTDLEKLDFGWEWFRTLLNSPAVGCAILGYIVMFGVWLHILQRTNLSRAFMMTGLVYVTVPAAAWVIFGERIGPTHAAGIALIIAGIVLMGPPGGPPGGPHQRDSIHRIGYRGEQDSEGPSALEAPPPQSS